MAGGTPEIEPVCEHLWDWFWDLNNARHSGMAGCLPITNSEIKAWADMTGNIIRREELKVLRDMDLAFVAAANNSKDGKPAGEATPISVASFDAVFG